MDGGVDKSVILMMMVIRGDGVDCGIWCYGGSDDGGDSLEDSDQKLPHDIYGEK